MTSERLPLSRQIMILVGLMVVTLPFRFLPYWLDEQQGWMLFLWGASPVLALFLLGVAKCRSWWLGMALPLAGYVITDMIIEIMLAARGWETSSLRGRLVMYALFLALSQLGLLARWVRGIGPQIVAGIGAGMLGSILFFLVTNFLVWLRSTPGAAFYYPPTWDGLMQCYTLALPFFQNQFLFDILFAAILFPAYAVLEDAMTVPHTRQAELVEAD